MYLGQTLLAADTPANESVDSLRLGPLARTRERYPQDMSEAGTPAPLLPSALRVSHIQLDSGLPSVTLTLHLRETLVYCLTGRLRIYSTATQLFLGAYGGRRSILDQHAHVVRFPAGSLQTVSLLLDGAAADCLLVSCDAPCNLKATLPYMHTTDTVWHTVGTGTHQRLVGEVPTPPGYVISAGQTIQQPGTTSSWPAHATAEDLERYAAGETTWEEYFYVVCEKPGRVQLDGLYDREERVKASQPLENGAIVRMPLGSHPVTAAPDGWLSYHWFYCGTALQKQYNISSKDTGTYRK